MNKANKDNKHLYSSIANDPSKSLELFFSTWALKNKIRKQNPSIFHFNNQSFFIYEPRYYQFWIDKLTNKNNLKPNDNDISFLINYINSLQTEQDLKNNNYLEINIVEVFYEFLNKVKLIKPKENTKVMRIKEIIINANKSMNISCRRIKNEYIKKYDEYISHTTVNRIMKNILKYRFVKCSVKTDKLQTNESIKQTFFFIKIFLRALKMGINFIFIDESSLYTQNNNYKTWKLPNENIYTTIKDSFKRNLLLAVSKDKTISFKLTQNTTTSNEFQTFFIQMLSCLDENEIQNSIFILDNHSSHLTPKLFKLYNDKKLKILFGVPYFSELNMIELVFRGLKNITYKFLFKSIEELENKVKELLNDSKFCLSYKFYFKEVLNNYLNFININKNINLNY